MIGGDCAIGIYRWHILIPDRHTQSCSALLSPVLFVCCFVFWGVGDTRHVNTESGLARSPAKWNQLWYSHRFSAVCPNDRIGSCTVTIDNLPQLLIRQKLVHQWIGWWWVATRVKIVYGFLPSDGFNANHMVLHFIRPLNSWEKHAMLKWLWQHNYRLTPIWLCNRW